MIGVSANKYPFGSIAKMQGTLHLYQYETVVQSIYPRHASHTKFVGEGSPQYLKIIYRVLTIGRIILDPYDSNDHTILE